MNKTADISDRKKAMEIPAYITEALRLAHDTKSLWISQRAITDLPALFRQNFGSAAALLVADTNTFAAAGKACLDQLRSAGIPAPEPFVMKDPFAGIEDVVRVQDRLMQQPGVPVAVGSGTINDLVKLASHRCGRTYLSVATAASMDGYTAYGASITADGSKQTFFCPAPRAVLADLDVIGAAPKELNAAGYADLAAKITAGADWLLADALGIEPIEPLAWKMVHAQLRPWLADPEGVRLGQPKPLQHLLEGLLMTGFAMQHCRSSRPASGAEHQFSHLWDMQHHTHQGQHLLHGCKVAVGTLAVTRLYEQLLGEPLENLDAARVLDRWPSLEAIEQKARQVHPAQDLQAVAVKESQAKYLTRPALAHHLESLKHTWPALRERLRQQLMPSGKLAAMLEQAGAPCDSEQIGISPVRLRQSYSEAQMIRRRYTVLDLAEWTGLMPQCLDRLFADSSEKSAAS